MMMVGVLGVASVVAATWQTAMGDLYGGDALGQDAHVGELVRPMVVVPRLKGLVAESVAGAPVVLRGVLPSTDDCNALRQWLQQQANAGVSNQTVCMPALLADANELLQGTALGLAAAEDGRKLKGRRRWR